MHAGIDIATARALLEWQMEMGALDPVGDVPVDRYDLPAAQVRATVTGSTPVASAPAPGAVPDDPVAVARAAAAGAADLDALRAALFAFDLCDLRRGARNLVFADGDPAARLMIIGEAPGRDEDRQGLPFVGAAGRLLELMLAAIDMGRERPDAPVYITNILPWRPPQNREPTAEEIAMMLPFVERHVALAAPDVIVLMGNVPCAALLGRRGITRMRGTWERVLGRPTMPTFHPAYLLRNPHAKREAWADLLAIRAKLREVS